MDVQRNTTRVVGPRVKVSPCQTGSPRASVRAFSAILETGRLTGAQGLTLLTGLELGGVNGSSKRAERCEVSLPTTLNEPWQSR